LSERKKRPFLEGCCLGVVLGVVGGPVLLAGLLVLAYTAFPDPFTNLMAGQLKPPAITAGLQADYDWAVTAPDGSAFPLSETRGKAVFLHFWSPSCPQCVAELDALSGLYDAVKDDERVAFVAVTRGDAGEAARYVERGLLRFPAYTFEGPLPEPYAQKGVPVSYLISPEGEVVFKHQGSAKWDDPGPVNYLKSLAAQAR